MGLAILFTNIPCRAEIHQWDFNISADELTSFGAAAWRPDNGFDNSGHLSITEAVNGQRGSTVFPALENAAPLYAFEIEADLRLGGGSEQPGEGFSFNLARPGDPVFDDGEGWASSPEGELNLPEEGTTTGLAIGFDERFSGGRDGGWNEYSP